MDGGLGLETIPHEILSSQDLPKLADPLRNAGYSDNDIHAILAGNFLRFFRDNLPSAHTPRPKLPR
jgi:microsomal dipeptidase-like Zn-dependent dipeptidase